MKTKSEWIRWYVTALLKEARSMVPPATQIDYLPQPPDAHATVYALRGLTVGDLGGWMVELPDEPSSWTSSVLTFRHVTWEKGNPGHFIKAADLSRLGSETTRAADPGR